MSRVDKLINGIKSAQIELEKLGLDYQLDVTWYSEELDDIIHILETNKSITSLFLKLIELINKLKGQDN